MVSLSNHPFILRQAQDERGIYSTSKAQKPRCQRAANRILTGATQATRHFKQPSFRRKPESRRFDSRHALFREDFLDSGFRRNDGFMLRLPWVGAGL